MRLRRLLIGGGLAASGMALLAWLPPWGDAGEVGAARALPWVTPPSVVAPVADAPQTAPPAAWNATPNAVSPTAPLSAAASALPVTVTAPSTLRVGELHDVVIGIGPNAGVGEITFTLQVDANVLQVRAGAEGAWAASNGITTRFAAAISDAEDRVQVRSTVLGRATTTGARQAGGSVVIVQIQAMAPGSTSLLISDLMVTDVAGQQVAVAMPTANVQLTVESLPPQRPPVSGGTPVSDFATHSANDGD